MHQVSLACMAVFRQASFEPGSSGPELSAYPTCPPRGLISLRIYCHDKRIIAFYIYIFNFKFLHFMMSVKFCLWYQIERYGKNVWISHVLKTFDINIEEKTKSLDYRKQSRFEHRNL